MSSSNFFANYRSYYVVVLLDGFVPRALAVPLDNILIGELLSDQAPVAVVLLDGRPEKFKMLVRMNRIAEVFMQNLFVLQLLHVGLLHHFHLLKQVRLIKTLILLAHRTANDVIVSILNFLWLIKVLIPTFKADTVTTWHGTWVSIRKIERLPTENTSVH